MLLIKLSLNLIDLSQNLILKIFYDIIYTRLRKSRKETKMLSRVGDYERAQMLYNWIVFLGEIALYVLAGVMIYFLYRYLRAVNKRVKAVKNIRKSAEIAGFKCKKTGNYLNFDCHNMETCMVLTKGLTQYNVRFLSTFGKNRNLRFYSPDEYVSEKIVGYILLNAKGSGFLSWARIFKPKNIPGNLLKWIHTETFAFPSKRIRTTGVENLQSGNVHEVVIFNPVPLRAYYLDKTLWKLIVGGETWKNLSFHDISTFCSLIERS